MDTAVQNNFQDNTIKRVDSGATDESPFGSSLTTPVDEDIDLFHGIEQRLLNKHAIDVFEASESGAYISESGTDGPSPKLRPFSNAALESQEISEIVLGDAALPLSVSFPPIPIISVPSDASSIADQFIEDQIRSRSSSIYSLPNLPINIESSQEEKSPLSHSSQLITGNKEKSYQIDFSALPFADSALPVSDDACFASPEIDSIYNRLPKITREDLIPTVFRIIIFLPWCVAVGGAIFMCPKYLDLIAFGPGYVETPRGIYRFAYWADSGMQHVGIFLGFLATVVWLFPTFGILLIAGVAALAVYAWHDFVVDPDTSLGADDRQTMYLVATQFGFPGNTEFSKMQDSDFLSWLEKEDIIISDSDDDAL